MLHRQHVLQRWHLQHDYNAVRKEKQQLENVTVDEGGAKLCRRRQSGTAQAGRDSTCCTTSAAVESVLGCYLRQG